MKNVFKKIGYYLSLPFVGLAAFFILLGCAILARKYKKRPKEVYLEDRLKKVYKAFRKYLYYKRIKYVAEGVENIHMTQHLFVANHKSSTDPMVIFCALYDAGRIGETTVIAKQELQKKWSVRVVMALLDGIFIKRDDGRSIWACYEKETELVKNGRSVIVFPETTRIHGDVFGEFKSATLKVAFQNTISIAPVVIFGTEKARTKGKVGNVVSVSFLKVLNPTDFINIKEEQLMANIKEDMFAKFNELKQNPLKLPSKK